MVFWNAIAGAAQGAVGSDAFNAAVDANNRISAGNAKARNSVRQASNLAEAAHNNLARWIQSLNNNRMLDAGAKEMEASIVNYRRSNDAFVTQGFAQTIRQAEQAGAAAAAQAAAGIEGGVVDMVNGSTALRDSIVNQQFEDMGEYMASDAARRAGNIMTSTIQGLDGSIIIDTLDYNIDVPQAQVKFSKFQNAMFGMIKHMGGVTSDPQGQQSQKQANIERGETRGVERARAQGDTRTESEIRADFRNGADNDQLPNQYRFDFNKQDSENDPYSMWGNSGDTGTGDSSNGNNYFAW